MRTKDNVVLIFAKYKKTLDGLNFILIAISNLVRVHFTIDGNAQ